MRISISSGSAMVKKCQDCQRHQQYEVLPNEAATARIRTADDLRYGLDREIITQLSEIIHLENPFVGMYKTAYQAMKDNPELSVIIPANMRLVYRNGTDPNTYNLPVSDEVSMLIDMSATSYQSADIIRTLQSSQKQIISCTHPAFLPLRYVLLFPSGDSGWHPRLKLTDDGRLSQCSSYRYRLYLRPNSTDHLFRSQRLFQEFLVTAWAETEQNQLGYIRNNQSKFRIDLLHGVQDALVSDADMSEVGHKIILPSSIIGSPRFMHEKCQDAMAICRYLGHPSLFITFTANPHWEEIKRELLPGQVPSDGPDLVCRVFNQKFKIMLDLITLDFFGKCTGFTWTMEYQKRGLPHIHLLVYLSKEAKDNLNDPYVLDQVINAELPDASVFVQELFDIVASSLIHSPCGDHNTNASCMRFSNGTRLCRHHFPKEYQTWLPRIQKNTIIQKNTMR